MTEQQIKRRVERIWQMRTMPPPSNPNRADELELELYREVLSLWAHDQVETDAILAALGAHPTSRSWSH